MSSLLPSRDRSSSCHPERSEGSALLTSRSLVASLLRMTGCRFSDRSFDVVVERKSLCHHVSTSPEEKTMRYMMFIKHREDFDMSKVPQSLFGAMDKFIAESAKEGVFVDGAGLQPSKTGHK